jgi:hypothetical protein
MEEINLHQKMFFLCVGFVVILAITSYYTNVFKKGNMLKALHVLHSRVVKHDRAKEPGGIRGDIVGVLATAAFYVPGIMDKPKTAR